MFNTSKANQHSIFKIFWRIKSVYQRLNSHCVRRMNNIFYCGIYREIDLTEIETEHSPLNRIHVFAKASTCSKTWILYKKRWENVCFATVNKKLVQHQQQHKIHNKHTQSDSKRNTIKVIVYGFELDSSGYFFLAAWVLFSTTI